MTAKSNVIQLSRESREAARTSIAEVHRLSDLLNKSIRDAVAEIINRFLDAEARGLERIEEYVPQDRLLTLKEAAAYLGYKPRTVRSWCHGTHLALQHALIGGELRFKKLWLDQMIEKKSVKPPTIKL